jgi:hypothetical protein
VDRKGVDDGDVGVAPAKQTRPTRQSMAVALSSATAAASVTWTRVPPVRGPDGGSIATGSGGVRYTNATLLLV